jgi:Ca2+-binding EF-hand superfamily protein
MVNGISGLTGYATQMMSQSTTRGKDDLFDKIDKDSDGGISQEEFGAFLQKMSEDSGTTYDVEELFSTYDADGDGLLSQNELDAFMKENAPPPPPPNQAAEIVQRMSTEEKQQLLDNLVQKIDSNGDGSIDAEEFSAFTEKMSSTNENVSSADRLKQLIRSLENQLETEATRSTSIDITA